MNRTFSLWVVVRPSKRKPHVAYRVSRKRPILRPNETSFRIDCAVPETVLVRRYVAGTVRFPDVGTLAAVAAQEAA